MKRFCLSNKERIKRKNDFKKIYDSGEIIFSAGKKLKALFLIDNNNKEPGIKTAFAVSKKAGNAVWRNRAKRLLRESYRLNQNIITGQIIQSNKFVYIVFSLNKINNKRYENLYLKDIMPDVVDMMNQIKNKI